MISPKNESNPSTSSTILQLIKNRSSDRSSKNYGLNSKLQGERDKN